MSLASTTSASRKPAGRRPVRRAAAPLSYLDIYRADPLARIEMVKTGLPATRAKEIISDLAMPVAAASGALNVSVATINRKAKAAGVLAQDESERFLGLARLIGQVQAMVDEFGDPHGFDAKAWTSRWLQEPLPALGGARPVELMDTMEGQGLVSETLSRARSGAYG